MNKSTKILTVILTFVLICSFGLHCFAEGYSDTNDTQFGLPFSMSIPLSMGSGDNIETFWLDVPSVPDDLRATTIDIEYRPTGEANKHILSASYSLDQELTVSLINYNAGQLFKSIKLNPSVLPPDTVFGIQGAHLDGETLAYYSGYCVLDFSYYILSGSDDSFSISDLYTTSITSTYVENFFAFDLSSLGLTYGQLAVVVGGNLEFHFDTAPTDWVSLVFYGTSSPTFNEFALLLSQLSTNGTDLTIFEQFTAFLEDFSDIFVDIASSAVAIFYNNGFTAIGIISLSLVGISLTVLIFRIIRRFLNFGG